jgi:hypothetical protein
MAAMVLMTVEGKLGAPSLSEAASQLGVKVEDIDPVFGVVPVDPSRGLYSVQVRDDRLPAASSTSQPYRGPFSNPEIAPFGPVQSGPEPAQSPPQPPTEGTKEP